MHLVKIPKAKLKKRKYMNDVKSYYIRANNNALVSDNFE